MPLLLPANPSTSPRSYPFPRRLSCHRIFPKSSNSSSSKESIPPDHRLSTVAAEGNKKGEKEPHSSQPIGEETEEGEQQLQEEQTTERSAQPSSSPSHPSTYPPPQPRTLTTTVTEVPPSTSTPKSPEGVLQIESVGPEETASSSSVKTSFAPSTLSGASWLAEKAIVLVRFAECFRRGRVIRYDAELNMCVVQLEFSNTVVNKGIEDICPDDPTVIAEVVKKVKEQEKSAQAGSSQTTDSNVPCPSSAPPFM
ncbi:unnamed protein product [Hymenolepis diminuta]|uniref:Sm domain-containing protein n=1 Tax=Hymenolepis diminuta TaxID=6216 RepID=A0A0R3SFA1_HYMDI|nr:unnamed protein product [Hymenolepis diminuta]